jgi:hypothetical protein
MMLVWYMSRCAYTIQRSSGTLNKVNHGVLPHGYLGDSSRYPLARAFSIASSLKVQAGIYCAIINSKWWGYPMPTGI